MMGAPRALTPETEAQATELLAQGKPIRLVARIVGIAKSSVGRLAQACRDRIQAMQKRFTETRLEMVLGRHGTETRALLDRIEDPETDAKGVAACYRAMLEGIGVAGKGAGTSIYGDVNIGDVSIDLSQNVAVSDFDPERHRELMQRLEGG